MRKFDYENEENNKCYAFPKFEILSRSDLNLILSKQVLFSQYRSSINVEAPVLNEKKVAKIVLYLAISPKTHTLIQI